jgi:hypothetical protein
MKITDIKYKTYKETKELDQFDLKSMPIKPKWYLKPLAWILALPETFSVKSRIKKVNMSKLKQPYILLCNHNSFLDFKVATRAIFPKSSNYIVAVDGFINRESIMRNVGCFMKRKFVSDISLAKQVKHSLTKNKVICQIYPEARYSLVGTSSPLPVSLAKLVKWLKHPVVTLISHGHHLRQPFWNLKKRKVNTYTEMTQILTKDDLENLSVEQVNEVINKAFIYNDYKYQLDNNIRITEDFRAEGLHKPLYKCPHCLCENKMDSKGNTLFCLNCNETYEMDELGVLKNTLGKTLFSHIPDWFEWQREEVRKEIELGKYNIEIEVDIDILPNSDGFYRIGKGRLVHNVEGFTLEHPEFNIHKPAVSNFGVHIEYDYFGRGDGISFSTNEDTFYIYPISQDFNVTKFHFAAEEVYNFTNR